jgi:predicted kinase
MKDLIKKLLRENVLTNSLGVNISKPDQKLIIMRGIPGSGKSTKAKELVEEGSIHSTDDVISSKGNYQEFFDNMKASGNFSMLSAVHAENLRNAVKDMEIGITPVVIDNTNIKPFESKPYIENALKLGYDDKNIVIVDIGTNGMLAEELARRNTHGVPLDKIKSMIDSYNSFGDLTVDKIMQSENIQKENNVLYSAVVLDEESRNKLFSIFNDYIPEDWKKIGHHMTIVFGKGLENKEDLNKKVHLTVTEIGVSDMAIAARVDGYQSKNSIPHITLAINPNGGKPVMSNQIENWQKVNPFIVYGIVTEIKK